MAEISGKETIKLAGGSIETMEQLTALFSVYNDITDRMQESHEQLKGEVGRLRKELKAKNELLERKSRLAALGEMAAGMAHEIRNPLGGVQLYASLLEKDLQGQDDSLQWVRKIINGVRSLDVIVNDMLAFTQDQVCQKTEVNLAALITEVLDYVRPQIKAKSVRIDVSCVEHNLMAEVDLSMMRRVLMNLILNAVEVVDLEGEVVISARRCQEQDPYNVQVHVMDNGGGIQQEHINKIFNPFYTTKDSGTGLGLAIVHRLVECHGGVITAVNNDKNGATFAVLLP